MPQVYNKRHKDVPKDAVYVGRPTKWGNPFSHMDGTLAQFKVDTREQAVEAFKQWVYQPAQDALRAAAKIILKGKDLVCWCAPADCHARIWVEIANS